MQKEAKQGMLVALNKITDISENVETHAKLISHYLYALNQHRIQVWYVIVYLKSSNRKSGNLSLAIRIHWSREQK